MVIEYKDTKDFTALPVGSMVLGSLSRTTGRGIA